MADDLTSERVPHWRVGCRMGCRARGSPAQNRYWHEFGLTGVAPDTIFTDIETAHQPTTLRLRATFTVRVVDDAWGLSIEKARTV